MARRRKTYGVEPEPGNGGPATDPANASMGRVSDVILPKDAPRNPDGSPATEGEISTTQAKNIGAVTLADAQKNKQLAGIIESKARGENVRWNSDDATEIFDVLKSSFSHEWPSLIIKVIRESPEPLAQFPPRRAGTFKDSIDFDNYVRSCHGMNGPATYRIVFQAGSGMVRGSGHIYMPDTMGVQVFPPQGGGYGQPSSPQSQASGYPHAGGYGGQPSVVVVSPQQSPQAPPNAAPMPPAPYSPPSSSPEISRALEMMSAQTQAMMQAVERMSTVSRRPPGFMEWFENYPVPEGFIAVPGGIVPDPRLTMRGFGHAPPPAPAPVHVAAPPPAPAAPPPAAIVAPLPPPSAEQQVASTIKTIQTAMRGFKDISQLISSLDTGGPEVPELPDPTPTPPVNPLRTMSIGGMNMVVDSATGKPNWGMTAMAALPEVLKAGEGIMKQINNAKAAQGQPQVLGQPRPRQNVPVQRQMMPQPVPQPPQVPQAAPPRPAPVPATVPRAAPAPRPLVQSKIPMPAGDIGSIFD